MLMSSYFQEQMGGIRCCLNWIKGNPQVYVLYIVIRRADMNVMAKNRVNPRSTLDGDVVSYRRPLLPL
jgi:hypothetical protein